MRGELLRDSKAHFTAMWQGKCLIRLPCLELAASLTGCVRASSRIVGSKALQDIFLIGKDVSWLYGDMVICSVSVTEVQT